MKNQNNLILFIREHRQKLGASQLFLGIKRPNLIYLQNPTKSYAPMHIVTGNLQESNESVLSIHLQFQLHQSLRISKVRIQRLRQVNQYTTYEKTISHLNLHQNIYPTQSYVLYLYHVATLKQNSIVVTICHYFFLTIAQKPNSIDR